MSVSAGDNIKLDWELQESPERLGEFQKRIDARELIEADDWMPQNYRIGMLRMCEHHANSEIVGALPEGEWITRAPSLKRKLSLIAKVQDEVGHGQMLYRVSQDLGKPRDAMLRDLITGKTKYHNVFNYPAPTWADVAAIQWLVDGAAIMNQKTLADGSYGPYVRTMKRINMEEAFHFKVGEDSVLTLMSGTPRQKQMMQEAFDRWWNPCLMFFGPPDKESVKTGPFMQWRIKTATNDELRQAFVNRFAPAAMDLGLEIKTYKREPIATERRSDEATRGSAGVSPAAEKSGVGWAQPTTACRADAGGAGGAGDCSPGGQSPPYGRVIRNADGSPIWVKDENIRFDEKTKNWGFSQPDWEEFHAVIRGNGPLNKQRVGLRRFSYEQGEWVRRAVLGQGAGLPPGRN